MKRWRPYLFHCRYCGYPLHLNTAEGRAAAISLQPSYATTLRRSNWRTKMFRPTIPAMFTRSAAQPEAIVHRECHAKWLGVNETFVVKRRDRRRPSKPGRRIR